MRCIPAKLAATMALALCSSGAFAQAPIKIGFVAELSGPQGALGQDQYDAFMMVVERNGGKLGGTPVQILREDSQLKPDVATQIVQKLIEKENVPIITGITFSNIMMAVHGCNPAFRRVSSDYFAYAARATPSSRSTAIYSRS
jgi:branched-chain amino acid transport system substrate-binding protein